jgi:tetratricopeptide (TPR) repeat protein
MNWPQTPMATAQGRQTFEVGVDKLDTYKGDPKTLAAALRTFQTGDSRPYAFAGVAYTLVLAAREQDGTYAEAGLDAAMEWLEKAQEMEPDLVDINVIEALIYTYSGRLDDARLVLDYLQQQDPRSFYLHKAEIAFWRKQGELEKTIYWFEQAVEEAVTVPQRLRLRAELGDFFLEKDMLDKALEVYREAVHFEKDNAWLWHKMSVVHWRQEDYEEAARCNAQALRLDDFPAARQMEEALKKEIESGSSGMLGRLFGRGDE